MNYILYGEERYLLKEALDQIKADYLDKDDTMNLIQYHARQDKVRTVIDDAMTVPFFADHKVIIVEQCDFLMTKGSFDWDIEELITYLENPLESTILVLVSHQEKLDSRKKAIGKIQKLCRCLNFPRLDENRKHSVVKELIQKKKISIDPDALQLLSMRLPLDMETIQKEINKFELYGEHITTDVVSAFLQKPLEEDVFALGNAIINKQMKKAFSLYHDLDASNNDAIYLLAVLASQFRFLYQVRVLMQKGYRQKEIADFLHAHPYRVKLSMQSVQALSTNTLLKMLAQCAKADQDMKAGKIDKKLGFELLLISFRRDQA